MTKDLKPRGLGRGLAALLGDAQPATPPGLAEPAAAAPVAPPPKPTHVLPIEFLRPGVFQPRTSFDNEQLAQLADSIRLHGLIQPILVRPVRRGDGTTVPDTYEIVAGERRWRAAQRVPLHEVPVVVRSMSDRETLEVALIENLQRADLSAIEEARAFARLRTEFGHTPELIGRQLGRSRSHVANMLRLLELPETVQELVSTHAIEAGAARALIGTPDPAGLADYVIAKKLPTRRVETLAAAAKQASEAGWHGRGLPPNWQASAAPAATGTGTPAAARPAHAPPPPRNADIEALERRLEEVLGLRVGLRETGEGEKVSVTIEVGDFDQLDELVRKLTRK